MTGLVSCARFHPGHEKVITMEDQVDAAEAAEIGEDEQTALARIGWVNPATGDAMGC